MAFDDPPLLDVDPLVPALVGDDDVVEPSDFPDDDAAEPDSDLAVVVPLDSDEPLADPVDSEVPPDFSAAGPPLADPFVTFSRLSFR